MAALRTHKDLIVWRKAVSLAARVHELTALFPAYDRQTLSQQMRRCAVAVASNIAEGAGRGSRAENIRYLDIARGALSELETQVCICTDLHIIERGSQLEAQVAEVGGMLSAMVRRLRENRDKAQGFVDPLRPSTSH